MISKQPIGNSGDAARYHDKAFSQDGNSLEGADNYYLSEQATAVWKGKGAEILQQEGKSVKREDFVAYLEGRLLNPATNEVQDLSKNGGASERRLGVDFTVSPPKSVSVVGLIAQDERIINAHLSANEKAMEWLEKNASVIRVKDENGKNVQVVAGNMLYATVTHETNRENEPQLHNHNVIAYAVYDKDAGKWRSMTNDQLFKLRAGADVIYKNELAISLEKAGYKLEFAENNVDFEIAGISKEQLEVFSKRSVQIREQLISKGLDPDNASFEARQAAALDSRSAKNELPRNTLNGIWKEAAQSVGLNLDNLVAASKLEVTNNPSLNQGRDAVQLEGGTYQAPSLEKDRTEALRAVSFAIGHLSEREQSFSITEIQVAALEFQRLPTSNVEWAIQDHISNDLLVSKGYTDKGEHILTTNKGIDNEKAFISDIQQGMGKGNVVLTDIKEFNTFLKVFEDKKSLETGTTFKLSDEQVNAARNILMHTDSYQGIQGEAGTGKTAALAMVRDVAEAKGWEVVGIATTASAATELQSASGIKSQTVASYLNERGKQIVLAKEEIKAIESAIRTKSALPHSENRRVEMHKLEVKSLDIDFGKAIYTFDHQTSEVLKSRNTLSNFLGSFLLDVANNNKVFAQNELAQPEKLIDRLKSQGADIAGTIGQKLMSYEKVGMVESIAARNTLYLEKGVPVSELKSQLEVKQAELSNLERTGNKMGNKSLLVMDESSMTGVGDAAKITKFANEINSRNVFQGDIKQHGSVPAGEAFKQAQAAGINLSELTETRRFDNATQNTKDALGAFKQGQYAEAMMKLDRTEVDQEILAKTTAERYLANYQTLKEKGMNDPQIGVVTITNNDRKAINTEIHNLLAENDIISKLGFTKSHIDDPKLTEAQQLNTVIMQAAKVDRLIFRKEYKEIGVQKGEILEVVRFDTQKNRIIAKNNEGKEIKINPQQQDFFSPGKHETRVYSVGDKVEARQIVDFYTKEGERIPDMRVDNGTRGVITAIDENGATVKWSNGKENHLNNKQMLFMDLAYAHTTYKEQGATNSIELFVVSKSGAKVLSTEGAYVGISRGKLNTELITSDMAELIKNVSASSIKTTSLSSEQVATLVSKQSTNLDQSIDKSLSFLDKHTVQVNFNKVEPTLEKALDKNHQADHHKDQQQTHQKEQKLDQGLSF